MKIWGQTRGCETEFCFRHVKCQMSIRNLRIVIASVVGYDDSKLTSDTFLSNKDGIF